jgi:hypothetical protein
MASTLKSNLDATYTINLFRLSQNSPAGQGLIWVFVEGDDDCKIYPKFFQPDKCKIEQVHGGCVQLEKALSELQEYTDIVIGIRDADFCHLLNNYSNLPNLFYTDCHDIEMTIIRNDTAFTNIFFEYHLQTESINIRQNILEEASFVGYIRYYNEINNCSINFEGLSFGNICTRNLNNKLRLQKNDLIQMLNLRSPDKTCEILEDVLNQFIQSSNVTDLYQLVNGHDFIKLLQCRINFIITQQKVSDKVVAKSLRASYQIEHFRNTQLYNQLVSWQNSHGYDIILNSQY